jgi:coenzyme F420 hydrogenase subunit beta
MSGAIRSILDVAERHLCTGCGACAYLAPRAIEMVDDLERGRRPLVRDVGAAAAPELLRACPGHALGHDEPAPAGAIPELLAEWGPILEVWEGFAGDAALRLAASSGGAASALALHGIEREAMHGVLHIAARPDVPWLNHTVLSRTRAELLAATGSRYAPASPCDGLQRIEEAPAPCVFIGKPCDVAAASRAARERPALAEKLGLTIAIFCAGTPSTRGTLELFRRLGIDDPGRVRSVRYRGNGWPGLWTVDFDDGGSRTRTLTYEESWGELQKFRQWRCYVCADHTGEFADIAVADPWYRAIPPGEPGRSLVLARTERGRAFLARAVAAGHLVLERKGPEIVVASQPNLLKTRGAVWGRALVTRLLGAAAPRYHRMALFPTWWRRLSAREKLSSLLGTAKRTFKKGLRRRVPVQPWRGPR